MYGIKALIREKRKSYKPSIPETTAANILDRDFDRKDKDPVWLTDATEIKMKNGEKVYLSAIYGLESNRIISYEVAKRNDNVLVFNTFKNAQKLHDTKGIIFHSDRGFQYISRYFKKLLLDAGMIQSMSRVNRCIDNGPMEGFWGLLKSEIFKGKKQVFEDFNQAKKEISKYMKFFNGERISLKMAALIEAQPSN